MVKPRLRLSAVNFLGLIPMLVMSQIPVLVVKLNVSIMPGQQFFCQVSRYRVRFNRHYPDLFCLT